MTADPAPGSLADDPLWEDPHEGLLSSSASALLMVVLGEFVWPRRKPVWSATLLAALAHLHVEPNGARKAIRRTAAREMITAGRQGRRVLWTLTEEANRLMGDGYERIYLWDARARAWDRRWLLVSVSVPESQRNLRHRMQSRLRWAGLGSPSPGLWLTPHTDRLPEVDAVLDELGLRETAMTFVGTLHSDALTPRVAERAWNLSGIDAEYRRFTASYDDYRAVEDREQFQARVALVQAWRRLPYRDPDLPREFLPDDWPGDVAAEVFRRRHHEWAVGSTRFWRQLCAAT